ncbi:tetratricopeptide repeat protein [Paucibacter sp. DJ2R-2]|uniref:tetratricopeptide repeat protein n=1 Tax=Paucibacter sp. DJ2R-2 TaxID=2893558 RepID=UPI0021E35885|nr:hypothetical protein [Paucibacter sp. DJ2R-2]MCV2419748.1 hypothetical protein [Paucibacter sp. DJ4R-1]MCV2437349.1 hypothetical protein [Paucibacter sp. DJ2R-2]
MTSPIQGDTAPSNAPADGADQAPAEAPTLLAPSTGVRPAQGEASGPSPTVRVEGLAETLHDVRHELHLLSHATKYNWINARLILLRNALIALSVLAVVVVTAVACVREAYRQTLTIAAFDVPENLAERGITGQVVAKALFDELLKRRELVTTLESGELKGAWAEHRADVAIPEAKFTLQSVFRYLRYMTGNEIAIDGEIILDGDDATLKVRVAGKSPTIVKGKLAAWESLVGELAVGVLDVTQPAVLAAYLGLQAKTPDDLTALSKHLRKMEEANPKPSGAVMSVAYDAYGNALYRAGKFEDALLAFAEAMALDSSNGVAVVNSAGAQYRLRNFVESAMLDKRAQTMKLPVEVKIRALGRRVSAATNTGDCDGSAKALREAKASPLYDARRFVTVEAIHLAQCEFEEARAVALVSRYYTLHPADVSYANTLLILQSMLRPEGRYREEGFKVARDAIAAGVDDSYIYVNFSNKLAETGRFDEAFEVRKRLENLILDPVILEVNRDYFAAKKHYHLGEYVQADAIFKRVYANDKPSEVLEFSELALVKLGLGQYDASVALYQDGLKLIPKNCQLWQELGKAHAARGRPEDIATALTTFDKGIAAVPKCGLTYNAAARLLIQQGRPAEARQKLEALIKISPKSDGAVIAKEILAGISTKS